ncbi:hypothetical protein GCM10011507_24060 [Edaphobacter acidisoli]|uniref:Uncharacterized protein n=2 Tax=Edaphobacter acidisoli TaxID=2040573 RepID=A0A916RUX8_9BACT|nr:hypothetical protein GCM10011507_24060 [Edaphobacter acidisoli]
MSLHWPLVGDASLMHYVVFLAGRGLTPYKDIVDVNLPGTYAVNWLVMHIFGTGALAWRLYDIALGLAAAGAMTWIAWPVDRLAGPLAGALFFLIHGRDGIAELGQRDLLMAVLLLWAVALVLAAMQRGRIAFVAVAAVLAGFAATVKPTAAVFWLVTLIFVALSPTARMWRRVWLWGMGLAPFLIAPVVELLVIDREGAWSRFWFVVARLDPLHNTLLRVPGRYFLAHPLPSTLLPLTVIGVVAVALRRHEGSRLFSAIEALVGINFLCGLFSFFIQRKALPYHRYPADAFLILLLCLIFFHAVNERQVSKALVFTGAAGLLFASLVIAPQSLARTLRLRASADDFSTLLQGDLTHLEGASFGGASLDGQVQCIDFTAGCATTLYRMRLRESTGFLYDCYAFQPAANAVVREYREEFHAALLARPPEVIVLSDQDCGHPDSFGDIDRWPALEQFIQDDYVLVKQVTPPGPVRWADNSAVPYSYRIYVRRR